jgi:hypothetical protein
MGCSARAGSGDVVAAGKEVTGMVPSDPPGFIVQPRVTMHETSTSQTQTVLMDIIDPDIYDTPFPYFTTLFYTLLFLTLSFY